MHSVTLWSLRNFCITIFWKNSVKTTSLLKRFTIKLISRNDYKVIQKFPKLHTVHCVWQIIWSFHQKFIKSGDITNFLYKCKWWLHGKLLKLPLFTYVVSLKEMYFRKYCWGKNGSAICILKDATPNSSFPPVTKFPNSLLMRRFLSNENQCGL